MDSSEVFGDYCLHSLTIPEKIKHILCYVGYLTPQKMKRKSLTTGISIDGLGMLILTQLASIFVFLG